MPSSGSLGSADHPTGQFLDKTLPKTRNPSPASPSSSMDTRDFVSTAQNSDDGGNQNNIGINNKNKSNNGTAHEESAVTRTTSGSDADEPKHGEVGGESITASTNAAAHDNGTSNDNDNDNDNDNNRKDQVTTTKHTSHIEMEGRKPDDPRDITPTPSIEQSEASLKEVEEDSDASLSVTLLLTTGARHPLKIDAKYLRKQSISLPRHDPFEMSVYTLKELIWREWRSDWDPRPSSPSLIRLISFGKLLDDKVPLSECKFNHDAPNVVHMTVKPQEALDEEDSKGAKDQYVSHREAGERSPRCRCIIL